MDEHNDKTIRGLFHKDRNRLGWNDERDYENKYSKEFTLEGRKSLFGIRLEILQDLVIPTLLHDDARNEDDYIAWLSDMFPELELVQAYQMYNSYGYGFESPTCVRCGTNLTVLNRLSVDFCTDCEENVNETQFEFY